MLFVLLALMSFSASAASYEYHISPGDNFTSAQYGDDLTEISQKLNMSVDDLNAYFNKNGILYLAVSNNTKTQIRLSAFADNFSSAVGDMSLLNDETLTEFLDAVSNSGDNTANIITNGNRKFICTKSTLKDSGGMYTVTQYITICSNKTFYLAGYNEGEDTSNEIKSAFESFYLTENQISSKDYTLPFVYITAGVVFFTAVSIIMILGIIKAKRQN